MASEYIKWKIRDVQPDTPIEYTRQQKRANWLYYHKWHFVVGVVLILILLNIGKSMLGIDEVKPDYQIAYIGTNALPEDAAAAVEEIFASLGQDCNGDGKVTVQLNQYATYDFTDNEDTDRIYYAQAAQVSLMSDLESCDSFFFLLEEYETFQKNYMILSYPDGSLPDEWDTDYPSLVYAWTRCPVLADLNLGEYTETVAGTEVSGDIQELLSGLYLARRGFWSEKTCSNLEGCETLWNRLTVDVTE